MCSKIYRTQKIINNNKRKQILCFLNVSVRIDGLLYRVHECRFFVFSNFHLKKKNTENQNKGIRFLTDQTRIFAVMGARPFVLR